MTPPFHTGPADGWNRYKLTQLLQSYSEGDLVTFLTFEGAIDLRVRDPSEAEAAEREARREPIIAPGAPPGVSDPSPFLTSDCIQPPQPG